MGCSGVRAHTVSTKYETKAKRELAELTAVGAGCLTALDRDSMLLIESARAAIVDGARAHGGLARTTGLEARSRHGLKLGEPEEMKLEAAAAGADNASAETAAVAMTHLQPRRL